MTKSHRDIIELWPSVDVVASDIDVSSSLVRMWKFRMNIPSSHWVALVDAASGRDIPLTYKMLAETAAT